MTSVRINKFLAERLGLSRRESDEYVASGRVLIDGQPARLGQSVDPSSQIIVDGKVVDFNASFQYILIHKPVGYVCSRKRQGNSPTIYELLPDELRRLKPVGRLDRDSSGILVLTNDGDFAHQMTHPKFYKTKIYEVTLDRPLQPLHRQMIADFGVILEDGKSQFGLDRIAENDENRWLATMSEGRNRQIRRTFAALGYNVTALSRTKFGDYTIDGIEPGEYTSVNMR